MLPSSVTKHGGLHSGFMIAQYAAASMVSENKVYAHPASVDAIPSSANQEDHVSMGTTGARKAAMILDNSRKVLGIELFAVCQALWLRGVDGLSPATRAVYDHVRKTVPAVEEDIVMYPQTGACDAMIQNREITAAAEKVCGALKAGAVMLTNQEIRQAMTIQLSNELPEYPEFVPGIRRAPDRGFRLTPEQTKLALKNALRYVPPELHEKLAPEFLEELKTRGRIYAYRYRPQGRIYGKPIEEYKGKCIEGKAFQVMIDNNLDFEVALYPYELTTYGETGQVCQNWLQYRLIKMYSEALTDHQTLVVASGHPVGLFPSHPGAPGSSSPTP